MRAYTANPVVHRFAVVSIKVRGSFKLKKYFPYIFDQRHVRQKFGHYLMILPCRVQHISFRTMCGFFSIKKHRISEKCGRKNWTPCAQNCPVKCQIIVRDSHFKASMNLWTINLLIE